MKIAFLMVISLMAFVMSGCQTAKNSLIDETPVPALEASAASIGETQDHAEIKAALCPSDMVLVDDYWCPEVSQTCEYCVDSEGTHKIPCGAYGGQGDRCGKFKFPSLCLSDKKIHKRFCVDQFEIPNIKGQRPTSWLSYTDAENFCKSKGKRILTDSEWTLSCETGAMKPYPYLDGYTRHHGICNIDNPINLDVSKAKSHNTEMAVKLDLMLIPSGSMKDCHSDYGIYDQIGDTDEWVYNDTSPGYKTGLKGGHIFGVRGRCRAQTTGHSGMNPPAGVGFRWYETSSRCGKDIRYDSKSSDVQ